MITRLIALFVVLFAGYLALDDRFNMAFLSQSEAFVTGIGGTVGDAFHDAAAWLTGIIGV